MATVRRYFGAFLILLLIAGYGFGSDLTSSLKPGKADLKSAGALAFGPDGVLFVGDFYGATIYAIDTGDRTPTRDNRNVDIKGVAEKIAAMLGSTEDQILINDVVVNPISRNIYISVSRGRGLWPSSMPVLVRVQADGSMAVVGTDNVKYSQVRLQDTTTVRKGTRGWSLDAITDLAFVDNQVLVAGMSNEDFSSDFRAIPFPFADAGKGTTVEIFHGSHGRYETRSPIRTFVPYKIQQEQNIIAAYTCTPLVRLPLSSLKPGKKVTGMTIAELGAANRPLDMMVYRKNGQDYLLLSTSSRGVMKMPADGLESFEPITTPSDVSGVPYETIAGLNGIEHLESYDDQRALILYRDDNGPLELRTIDLP